MDPFVHFGDWFGIKREVVIVPFTGEFADSGVEAAIERLQGRGKGGAD